MHNESHPAAGKIVRIKKDAKHPQMPDFGGSEYRIEDWWDKLAGKSWMDSTGNFACVIYAIRNVENKLPLDNEVVYGKIGCFGHLVHISEIENIE
jgi:hypothetical protein